MIEIDEDFEAGGDHLVRLSALDVGHESDAARVVLVAGVIKSLRMRISGQSSPHNSPSASCHATDVQKFAHTRKLSPCRFPHRLAIRWRPMSKAWAPPGQSGAAFMDAVVG
jgi:hypothetical protein